MNRKTIIPIIISLMLAAACFLPLAFVPKDGDESFDVVFFGDSIVAGDGYHDGVAEYFAGLSGLKTLNAGFGGITMSDFDLNNREDYTLSAYTMYELSKCVKMQDFSFAAMAYVPNYVYAGEYWGERISDISKLKWSSVKYVIIEQGINDYSIGVPIDNPDDKYDYHTFSGTLRSIIENVREGIPDAYIVITTPIHCLINSKYCDSYDFGGGYLSDYVSAEKKIAEEYGVFLVDNYNDIDINQSNVLAKTVDGLHPNSECAREIAENVFAKMSAHFDINQ